ncbi:hypothetical protein CH333_04045 [candidate division WOR-3 bacterium JGI_Cruoil_03_44_89]|uniref:Uncharacterized protein n=1 Tax=candidate division WOR-3 bacterium JGI_Cruoil_03_44_89 TaxID=1973748 RepID=A0A235BXA5_UNCW3|nr:MAG: hypothetical protein CH333_04045 [candidate division WOR-3 bacterium JGI_Cruoil_03_44_89]
MTSLAMTLLLATTIIKKSWVISVHPAPMHRCGVNLSRFLRDLPHIAGPLQKATAAKGGTSNFFS